jgi:hypothetical protein
VAVQTEIDRFLAAIRRLRPVADSLTSDLTGGRSVDGRRCPGGA